jgi:hypothetical protein
MSLRNSGFFCELRCFLCRGSSSLLRFSWSTNESASRAPSPLVLSSWCDRFALAFILAEYARWKPVQIGRNCFSFCSKNRERNMFCPQLACAVVGKYVKQRKCSSSDFLYMLTTRLQVKRMNSSCRMADFASMLVARLVHCCTL